MRDVVSLVNRLLKVECVVYILKTLYYQRIPFPDKFDKVSVPITISGSYSSIMSVNPLQSNDTVLLVKAPFSKYRAYHLSVSRAFHRRCAARRKLTVLFPSITVPFMYLTHDRS